MSILAEIAEKTRERVRQLKTSEPKQKLAARAQAARAPHDFRRAFEGGGYNIIAEVKFASPSEGSILKGVDAVAVADDYLAHGAAALSVLTEPHYFKGDVTYLERIREKHPRACLLMKDFVVDEYQLHLARASGADAVLILLAMLENGESERLYRTARGLGLTPLVEVHTEDELDFAARLGADLIGINNRNLKTMKVSLGTSEELARRAPKGATLISESGIKTNADLKTLCALGYRGFLVGTHLMRTGTPGKALAALLNGGLE